MSEVYCCNTKCKHNKNAQDCDYFSVITLDDKGYCEIFKYDEEFEFNESLKYDKNINK